MTSPQSAASPTGVSGSKREAVLHVMAAASFLVFFQAYLVAPLIPSLSVEFHASTDLLGMLVPAYMLPYGISTLWPLCVLTLLRAITAR
jgi:predicted MFS family arabinose efflux permease